MLPFLTSGCREGFAGGGAGEAGAAGEAAETTEEDSASAVDLDRTSVLITVWGSATGSSASHACNRRLLSHYTLSAHDVASGQFGHFPGISLHILTMCLQSVHAKQSVPEKNAQIQQYLGTRSRENH